jgi:beta-N-acetylhexosaminidase
VDTRRRIRRFSAWTTWLLVAGLGGLLLNDAGDRPILAPSDGSLRTAPATPALSELDRMIGQMLIVGFHGQSPSDGWTRKLLAQIRAGKIGGVILMDRNIVSCAQVMSLNAVLQAAGPPLPLLVAVDQEGGAVQRLGPKQGIAPFPDAATVARQGSAETAGALYAGLAAELEALGFNLNLGPVVDLGRNQDNPIITRLGRSFGTDPATVSAFARAFIRAHRQAGVLTAAKHFPGHGSSADDSHMRLVDLTKSWSEAELEPYRSLNSTERPPIVMVGHLHHDQFNAKAKVPATLSKAAIEGLLRREIGYAGAVMTDDLDMGAIRRTYRLEDAAVLAIAAGNDLVLLSNTSRPDPDLPERLLARIRAAVNDGTVPRRRIEEAYRRIAALKVKLAVRPSVSADPSSCFNSH